jgi:hypothetical protein
VKADVSFQEYVSSLNNVTCEVHTLEKWWM